MLFLFFLCFNVFSCSYLCLYLCSWIYNMELKNILIMSICFSLEILFKTILQDHCNSLYGMEYALYFEVWHSNNYKTVHENLDYCVINRKRDIGQKGFLIILEANIIHLYEKIQNFSEVNPLPLYFDECDAKSSVINVIFVFLHCSKEY